MALQTEILALHCSWTVQASVLKSKDALLLDRDIILVVLTDSPNRMYLISQQVRANMISP